MSTQEPREIAFEDIKKGDDIEVSWQDGGRTTTVRGVARDRKGDGWQAEGGYFLAWDRAPHETVTLLHRPAPAEPMRLGAVVRARPLGTLTDATDLYVRFAKSGDKGCTWIRVGEGGGFRWADLDPDSIDVLPEGIEVES